MNTREFDTHMRSFELSNDEILRPSMYTVVRLDGRNFSRLTRDVLKVKPFNIDLATTMRDCVRALMTDSGWSMIYGYTQSDEISLLLDPSITKVIFAGKVRKINSILASYCSVVFYKEMFYSYPQEMQENVPTFDSRVIQLPNLESVADYFAWRRNDSETNCLNAYAYYHLTKEDKFSPTEAQSILDSRWNKFKHDILFWHDNNYNNIPDWQKRGVGFYWKPYEKDAINKKTGEKITVLKKELLMKDNLHKEPVDYLKWIKETFRDYMFTKAMMK